MSRSAVIVGAGIGGLSAGIALQRAGWSVRVFIDVVAMRSCSLCVASIVAHELDACLSDRLRQ